MCDLEGAHASGTVGLGVIGKLGWCVESSILLYLLGECAHSTLSDDIPYIALEGWPVELNRHPLTTRNLGNLHKNPIGLKSCHLNLHEVQQVDSLAEGVYHHVLFALLVAKDKGEVLQEVMVPVFESLNDDIKLTVVNGVSRPHVIQLLAELLYGMTFLAKDTLNTNAQGITGDLKYLAKVGKRSGNGTKVSNEATVERR
ncbi:unnamed protein product [Spirodela intermedia]|uniref:Uncharacterized protein n=1 Tax=Spirodela intermedia TaxID=51605 RepID=A0A7I8JBW8_SPIIN|nr:unnamed protein product [Spirodela intermedia]CAA6667677.1 unnamed protein product [Spirodela intermedia]